MSIGTYNFRLSGTIINILLVGALSVFRDRPAVRKIVTALGMIFLIVGGVTYVLPLYEFRNLQQALLIVGFAGLLAGTLSRPEFNVYVGEPEEVQERRVAEEKEADARDPYAALDLASKRLNEYYAINQSQARGSFRWAVFAMFCGLGTIVAGIWIFYLGDTRDNFLTSLSTVSGLVINTISALYLYLHNKTQKRSLYYYNQLVRLQQLGLLIRMVETHEDNREKANAKDRVIDEVLKMVSASSLSDSKTMTEEAT